MDSANVGLDSTVAGAAVVDSANVGLDSTVAGAAVVDSANVGLDSAVAGAAVVDSAVADSAVADSANVCTQSTWTLVSWTPQACRVDQGDRTRGPRDRALTRRVSPETASRGLGPGARTRRNEGRGAP